MEELPLPGDPDTAWAEMQSILDKDPLLKSPEKGSPAAKIIGSKLATILGYILPAAAMISTVTYLVVKQPKHDLPVVKQVRTDLPANPKQALPGVLDSVHLESPNPDSTVLVLTGTPAVSAPILVKPSMTEDSLPAKVQAAAIEPSRTLEKVSNADVLTVFGSSNEDHLLPANTPLYGTLPELKFSAVDVLKSKEKKSFDLKVKKEKNKTVRAGRSKGGRGSITTVPLNFGVNAGLSMYSQGKNPFVGVSATYALSDRLLVNAGVTMNFGRQFKGEYEHPSFSADSNAHAFRILDSRKFNTIDIPVSLEYRISKHISVKAGPVFSFQSKQRGTGSVLDKVSNLRDTLYHSKQINEALGKTTINKVNFGFFGGVTVRIGQFNIDANYQQNSKPYQISGDLGSYQYQLKSFQIGLGYRFK